MLHDIKNAIQASANPKKAELLARFFKTKEGEYGHGDVFLGLTVPQSRKIALQFKDLSTQDIKKLLESRFHEERLIALLLLIQKYKTGTPTEQKNIFDLYLSETNYINNWDLVDLSADKIVGEFIAENSKTIALLKKLAHSDLVWERRIAILSTFAFLKRGSEKETFEIAELLLYDNHDLIQKAVGWLLREVGKRVSRDALIIFLKIHYKTMPRTMLRYSIEHFPEKTRKAYLAGSIQ